MECSRCESTHSLVPPAKPAPSTLDPETPSHQPSKGYPIKLLNPGGPCSPADIYLASQLDLLEKGVRFLARGNDLRTAKIPWKQVAEYIHGNGGSYLFGNSTCRKRWDKLVADKVGRNGKINSWFFDGDGEDQ